MASRKTQLGGWICLLLGAAALMPAGAGAASRVSADFNGDGADDLAVGVPHESDPVIGLHTGGVNVIYGAVGAGGLTDVDNRFFTQGAGGIQGFREFDDQFANSLAGGDFDDDGFDDLAVGVRHQDFSCCIGEEGVVHVIYGTAGGLDDPGNEVWSQGSGGIVDTAEPDDTFGTSLATGDFDGDGVDDLAIGAPEEDVGAVADAGAVNVIYGTAGVGLTDVGNQIWDQDVAGIRDSAEQTDYFGNALASGDMDGDGADDLAIGVHGEDVSGLAPVIGSPGALSVIYGTVGVGLTAGGDNFVHQDTGGVRGISEADDLFGNALAAGDMDGDGFDDLAIGVVGEDLGAVTYAGAVNVFYGSGGGLSAAGDQFWTQNTGGIGGTADQGDEFGEALTVGDMSGDGIDDLAVGVASEDLGAGGPLTGAGTVNVIYGVSPGGLDIAGDQRWDQDSSGIRDSAESGDNYGDALSSGDFDGDGVDDLAIGITGEETVGAGLAFNEHGVIGAIYGLAGVGLDAAGDEIKHQDSGTIEDIAEGGDEFGETMPGEHIPEY